MVMGLLIMSNSGLTLAIGVDGLVMASASVEGPNVPGAWLIGLRIPWIVVGMLLADACPIGPDSRMSGDLIDTLGRLGHELLGAPMALS